MNKITQFCSYCRAQYSQREWVLGYRYCPYDGYKLQPIEIKIPPLINSTEDKE